MASPAPSRKAEQMAELQRRLAENPELAFRAFNRYPWQADQVFSYRLIGALYAAAEPAASNMVEIALQVRVARYAEHLGIQVDIDAYKRWLSEPGNRQPRLCSDEFLNKEREMQGPREQKRLAILQTEMGYPCPPEPADPTVPSWQRAAPRAELFVPRSADAGPQGAEGGAAAAAAVPYPKKFEEIVRFLETGQTIPGVREIPDTVVEDPSISTRGKMRAPPKPWEGWGNEGSENATSTWQNQASPSGSSSIINPTPDEDAGTTS
ncbi:hypothetical protein F4802DRAFT_571573 [Xylaria palmicola]|nr:hypothetical protein F4802DRAFT_571573 [Xylaria palmicola]